MLCCSSQDRAGQVVEGQYSRRDLPVSECSKLVREALIGWLCSRSHNGSDQTRVYGGFRYEPRLLLVVLFSVMT